MSKLCLFSIYLMVITASSWSRTFATSAQQVLETAANPPVTQAKPVVMSIQFKDAEYYMRTYGKKAKPVEGSLVFEPGSKAIRFVTKGGIELDVSNNVITKMLYETTSSPRYVLAVLVSKYFLLTSSTKHFLTIEYKGPNGEAESAVIRLDKENYDLALTTAEAQIGLRVERIPER